MRPVALHVLLGLAVLLVTLGIAPSVTASAPVASPNLSQQQASELFLADAKVADWVDRYSAATVLPFATFAPASDDWDVEIWSTATTPPIEVARGRVDDETGHVTEAWTGPQVAWRMARGVNGLIGGRLINSTPVWLTFCAVFLLGLVDWRRPLSLRNLDLVVLLSFSVSLWFFNQGRPFSAVALVYPPLLYLLLRAIWVGIKNRAPAASRPVLPVWLLVVATCALVGCRVALNVSDSNVVDVGQSGVIGARLISGGQSPYGRFPFEDFRGDTYGPVAYESYLPAYWVIGWNGRRDTIGDAGYDSFGWTGTAGSLNAARLTSIVFDLACLIGLALVGLRFGGRRLAATLPFAWAAYPFTQYASSANTNDAVQAAFLVFGFWLTASPAGRGFFSALAAWTKFATLPVVLLWATYPGPWGGRRPKVAYASTFAIATLLVFSVLLLEPDPLHAAQVFWDRTLGFQLTRDSPFSIWDWRQYHAHLPDLHVLQRVLQVMVLIGAVAVAFVPRRKSPLQLAALTAALLIGSQLVLTHWSYPYLLWFFPLSAFITLVARREQSDESIGLETFLDPAHPHSARA